MTPEDVRAWVAVLRGLGGYSKAMNRSKHLFIQPYILSDEFGSWLRPFALRTSGRLIRHTPCQPDNSFHPPRWKVAVSGSSTRLARPPT
jgi:hypothetical protein